MTAEHWEELKRLFHDVSSRPRPEWSAVVAGVGARDPALGEQLAALLRAHQADESFLETSPIALMSSAGGLERTARLTTGAHLGPYVITAFIGAGGMGEVYRARDERLARDVAIKILPEDFARDATRHRRMQLEARAVGMLNHPNTLTVYDVGVHEGSPFLVTELLEGETLRATLEGLRRDGRAGMAVEEAWRIVRDIAAGLGAAHGRGIVHRDLKPENVFVTRDGRVKILDFGLAKLTATGDGAAETQTLAGHVLGTVGYMAPEQIRGLPAGPAADVFAAGVIFYELVSGRRAFEGDNPADTMAAILTVPPVPLRSVCPTVPAAAVAIVERCLAKSPAARYQSGAELARTLAAEMVPASWSDRGRPWPHFRTRIAAAVLTMVSLLGVAGWRITRRDDRHLPPRANVDAARYVVAVLPFTNVSADPAQNYFSAGITEEIQGQLSKLAALRLLSRSAIDHSSEKDGRRLAQALGAGSVVEGSVRLDKERVRIRVQLIDTRNQQSIWSEQYDRELHDIFAVQSDVALQIAEALRVTLSQEERRRVEKRPTENIAAYELYLKSQALNTSEREPNLRAIQMLRQALDLDPTFAAAQARMAYRTLFLSNYDDPLNLDVALEMVRKALVLDPALDEGHSVMGAIYSTKGESATARLSFLRAMELNPSQFNAMTNLSSMELELGRFDEALLWARRGFQLVPNEAVAYYHVALPLIYLAEHATSDGWLSEAQQRFPNSARLKIVQAMLAYQQGQDQSAETVARQAVEASPKNEELQTLLAELTYLAETRDAEDRAERYFRASPDITANWWIVAQSPRTRYAYLLARRGDAIRSGRLLDESLALAEKALVKGNRSPRVHLEMAAIHAVRLEKVPALRDLQHAYDAGWRLSRVLRWDPMFVSLRNEPGLQVLLKDMDADVADMGRRANIKATLPVPPPFRLPETSGIPTRP